MAKKRNIIIKQGLDGWVMTYGDMMSLLLTFFVLIVSFSSMQETKFEQAVSSLRDAFGVLASPESVIEFESPLIPNHDPSDEEAEVLYEVRAVEKFILDKGMDQQVEVQMQDDGVLFRLQAPFLFESGGADLKDAPRELLAELEELFRKFPYDVSVEGHTDSLPIHSAKFPSNWELSATRAVSVARYFQGLGLPPERLAATGFGEYRPVADNATVEGRRKNRRVEIFLELKQEDLPRDAKLPLLDKPGQIPAPTGGESEPTDKKGSVRPIINPVTGKLGVWPGTPKP